MTTPRFSEPTPVHTMPPGTPMVAASTLFLEGKTTNQTATSVLPQHRNSYHHRMLKTVTLPPLILDQPPSPWILRCSIAYSRHRGDQDFRKSFSAWGLNCKQFSAGINFEIVGHSYRDFINENRHDMQHRCTSASIDIIRLKRVI